MNDVVPIVGCGVFAALSSASCGWWLGRRGAGNQDNSSGHEARWAQEVLSCLNELTQTMATSVVEHSSRVMKISSALPTDGRVDPKAVAAAVAELTEANQRLERELATARDSLQKRAQQLETQAFEVRTDPLTRLANRIAFDEEIQRRHDEFQLAGRRLSLLLLDIDHFRSFNDAHGHLVGDEVLRSLAAALKLKTRTADLVARYSGEEFAVVMPGTSLSDAQGIGERIRKAVADHRCRIDGHEHRLTVSVGVAELATNEGVTELVRRADEALYAAKMAGRNSVWYHTEHGCFLVPSGSNEGSVTSISSHGTVAESAGEAKPEGNGRLPCADSSNQIASVWFESNMRLADRSAYCQQVRCRLAEWRRSDDAFSLALAEFDRLPHWSDCAGPQFVAAAVDYFASALNGLTREMDLVAQYSPTCFALLLPRTTAEQADTVARRLHGAVAQYSSGIPSPQPLTISVGITSPTEADDAARLLQRAEQALADAQTAGGNCTRLHRA